MARLFLPFWLAFKGWMLFEAVRRDSEQKWLWVILFVPGAA
ncbi:MAG: hypothetical protein AAGA56_01955 [Myxococcota bacterium]